MMMANKLDLQAILKRAEAATKGPWTNFDDSDYVDSTTVFQYDEFTETNVDIIAGCKRVWDAEFIAHARTDVVDLIAEVERLQGNLRTIERLTECPTTKDFAKRSLGGTATIEINAERRL
jgi:hypothetical protein